MLQDGSLGRRDLDHRWKAAAGVRFPVAVALAGERLSIVLGRLRAVGGYANLFVCDDDERVLMTSVIGEGCAIGDPAYDMTGDDRPGADDTVGTFLDYVAQRLRGVVLSAAVGHPACARDARTVEFANSP